MEVARKIFVGIVEDNKDPNRKGRIKVRVQTLYHDMAIEDIPYAAPFASLAGKSFEIPAIGKLVNVLYLCDDLYDPYYIFSENYNINLQNKLKDLTDEEYVDFVALLFDEKTQIYANNQELTLDYFYNKITIDKYSINHELKDNTQSLNLGSKICDQEAVLGTRFFEWMDKFISEFSSPFSLIGNLGAPILKPKLNKLFKEYQNIRNSDKNFTSSHVFIVDNNTIEKLERTPSTQNKKNDPDLIITPDNEQQKQYLDNEISKQNEKACQELKNAKPTSKVAMTPQMADMSLPLMGIRISSVFGLRIDPTNPGKVQGHGGTDIAALINSPVVSPADGEITSASFDDKYGGGNSIRINHYNGFKTGYCHLNKMLVKKGDKVKRDQIIGLVGNTGLHSTGPHLHFTVTTPNGDKVDPELYFSWPSRPNDDNRRIDKNSNVQEFNGSQYVDLDNTTPCDDNTIDSVKDDDGKSPVDITTVDPKYKKPNFPAKNIKALLDAMTRHNITSMYARKAILGVVSKESPNLYQESSYKNTSTKRIRDIFGQRFIKYSDQEIDLIKKDDEKFFDIIYGGKYGNISPGDGWKYRGRGFNQITFKSIYQELQNLYEKSGKKLGNINIINNPDLLNQVEIAAEFCILYFIKTFGTREMNNFSSLDTAVKSYIQANAGWGTKWVAVVQEGFSRSFAFAQTLRDSDVS